MKDVNLFSAIAFMIVAIAFFVAYLMGWGIYTRGSDIFFMVYFLGMSAFYTARWKRKRKR